MSFPISPPRNGKASLLFSDTASKRLNWITGALHDYRRNETKNYRESSRRDVNEGEFEILSRVDRWANQQVGPAMRHQ
jgi:hypothetical protein